MTVISGLEATLNLLRKGFVLHVWDVHLGTRNALIKRGLLQRGVGKNQILLLTKKGQNEPIE